MNTNDKKKGSDRVKQLFLRRVVCLFGCLFIFTKVQYYAQSTSDTLSQMAKEDNVIEAIEHEVSVAQIYITGGATVTFQTNSIKRKEDKSLIHHAGFSFTKETTIIGFQSMSHDTDGNNSYKKAKSGKTNQGRSISAKHKAKRIVPTQKDYRYVYQSGNSIDFRLVEDNSKVLPVPQNPIKHLAVLEHQCSNKCFTLMAICKKEVVDKYTETQYPNSCNIRPPPSRIV